MKQIFINIPVQNITKSVAFYSTLGFKIKPLFSDEKQKCMVWSEHFYLMLMTVDQFKTYSNREISSKENINAYFTLPVASFEEMNATMESGLKAGGKEPIPMIDEGFMQLRRIEDFDGHLWDFIFMNMDKFKQD